MALEEHLIEGSAREYLVFELETAVKFSIRSLDGHNLALLIDVKLRRRISGILVRSLCMVL
jgi:hypothetical protein